MGFWAALGGLASSLAGPALNIGGSLLGAEKQYGDQKKLMGWEHEYFKTRYQDTMRDMRAAGLNPILAMSGGFPSPSNPVGTHQVSQMQAPNFDLTNSAKNLADIYKKNQETKESVSRTALNWQKVNTEVNNTFKVRMEANLVKANERNAMRNFNVLGAQIDKTYKEIALMTTQSSLLSSQTDLAQHQAELVHQQEVEVKYKTEQLKRLILKLNYEMRQLEKESKVYKGKFGTVLKYIGEITDKLNLHIVASPFSMFK